MYHSVAYLYDIIKDVKTVADLHAAMQILKEKKIIMGFPRKLQREITGCRTLEETMNLMVENDYIGHAMEEIPGVCIADFLDCALTSD